MSAVADVWPKPGQHGGPPGAEMPDSKWGRSTARPARSRSRRSA